MHNHATANGETAYREQGNDLGDLRSDMQDIAEESDQGKEDCENVQPVRDVYSGQVGIAKAKLQKHSGQSDGRDNYNCGRTEESSTIGECNDYSERSD
jgi:hypothetical protein